MDSTTVVGGGVSIMVDGNLIPMAHPNEDYCLITQTEFRSGDILSTGKIVQYSDAYEERLALKNDR